MTDFFDDPAFVRELFEFVLAMELPFARAQIAAGADIVGIGDAAASLVGPRIYEEFVWPYQRKLVQGVQALGAKVRMHVCGNTRRILAGLGRLGCDLVDLDFPVPLSAARAAMGPAQVVTGNIHPVAVLRNGTPEAIIAAVAECHRQAGPRWVVAAGCEVPRDTPPENLAALGEYARSHQA
jgi:MtaA/CmuA family methyltransferase